MATSNTFDSMKPNFKESYSKKKRFSKVKKSLAKKATAQKEASENPEKFLEKMTEPSIKNVKGIAF
jgi:hypothetical protein